VAWTEWAAWVEWEVWEWACKPISVISEFHLSSEIFERESPSWGSFFYVYRKTIKKIIMELGMQEEKDLFPLKKCKFYAHYTSLNGLNGILKSRKVWMTDYIYNRKGNNDKTEVEYAFDVIKKGVESYIGDIHSREVLLKILGDMFSRNKTTKAQFYLYTASFCENLDSDDMFSKFAQSGKGVALIFNDKHFNTAEAQARSDMYVALTNVIYDETEVEKKITEIIERHINHPDKLAHIASSLLAFMPSIKHHSHSEEEEHRRFCCEGNHKGKWFPEGQDKLLVHTEILPNYVEDHEFEYDDLVEIKMGPFSALTEEQIRKKLERNGFDVSKVKITRSKFISE